MLYFRPFFFFEISSCRVFDSYFLFFFFFVMVWYFGLYLLERMKKKLTLFYKVLPHQSSFRSCSDVFRCMRNHEIFHWVRKFFYDVFSDILWDSWNEVLFSLIFLFLHKIVINFFFWLDSIIFFLTELFLGWEPTK